MGTSSTDRTKGKQKMGERRRRRKEMGEGSREGWMEAGESVGCCGNFAGALRFTSPVAEVTPIQLMSGYSRGGAGQGISTYLPSPAPN